MKLSNKDILIVIGIVVAVLVALTTLVYQDKQAAVKGETPAATKPSLHQAASEIFSRVIGRAKPEKVKDFRY